jgi:hypothetical protein
MNIHLVSTNAPSNLLIGSDKFLDDYNKLLYSNNYGFDLFNEKNNFTHTNKQYLIITDNSELKIDDLAYWKDKIEEIVIVTIRNIAHLGGIKAPKIVASNSSKLTPNSLISDKDLTYIVEYYNNNKDNYSPFKSCCQSEKECYCKFPKGILIEEMSSGWVPSYNNPDNAGCNEMSEPTGEYKYINNEICINWNNIK